MAAYTLPTSVEEATQQTTQGETGGSPYVQINLELKRLFEARENKLPYLVRAIVRAYYRIILIKAIDYDYSYYTCIHASGLVT